MVNIEKSFVENLFSIKDRVAIVTGATGALGGAVALGYAYSGCKVVLTARNEKKLQELEAQIKENGGECTYCAADPAIEEDFKKVIDHTIKTYGEVNILAVCHGYNKTQPVTEQSVADFEKVIDADLKSVYIVTKFVGEQMIKQGKGGNMVVASSARSKLGLHNYSAYCASKGGCDIMCQALACDFAQYGIRVNTINPTVFRSDLTAWMFDDDAVYKKFLQRIPIGRLGEPDDFVGVAIFLASDASNFITAANLPVDGGYWGN